MKSNLSRREVFYFPQPVAANDAFFFETLWYDDAIEYRINNRITAPELRVIGSEGENLGIMPRDNALALSREKGLDLIEIVPGSNPPVARIMDFDKLRYQKSKEEKKLRQAQKNKDMKQVRITPRAAGNDLQVKAKRVDGFLKDGHKVEINLFLRGREKYNKEWALKKLEEFLLLIQEPHQRTSEPKQGGRGYVVQVIKK